MLLTNPGIGPKREVIKDVEVPAQIKKLCDKGYLFLIKNRLKDSIYFLKKAEIIITVIFILKKNYFFIHHHLNFKNFY